MKYGMNMLLWTDHVTEDHYGQLEQLKAMGYDGVELPIFAAEEAHFKKLGQKLDELGLERTAVTVHGSIAGNPISTDPQVREAGLDHLKSVIDMCQVVGATHLCGPIHSTLGHFTGTGPTEEEWKHGKDTLAQAGDYAQKAGVTLVVEYLNRFECYFLTSAADCARFCREVESSARQNDVRHLPREHRGKRHRESHQRVCRPDGARAHFRERPLDARRRPRRLGHHVRRPQRNRLRRLADGGSLRAGPPRPRRRDENLAEDVPQRRIPREECARVHEIPLGRLREC